MTRPRFRVPREHGFWTMLGAVQIATLARVSLSLKSVLALACAVLVMTLGGMAMSRAVRRRPSLQVASAAILGLSGLPSELLLGLSPLEAMATSFAWAVLFVAGALLVRAAFARASRRGASPTFLELLAVAMTALAALGLALVGAVVQASALALSTVCLLVLARWQATPQMIKRLGLSLAVITVLAGTVMVGGASL